MHNQSIHYHLHSLRSICNSLISSLYILPLFDYCNNLLFNIPAYKLNKLQILQNTVVGCVFQLPCRSTDSIKPLLKQLHWLPIIGYRIKYKLSLPTHKVIHHNSPDYLVPLIYRPTTSNNKIVKHIPPCHPHLNNTNSVLMLSPCQPRIIGTQQMPPLVLSHLLASSNILNLLLFSDFLIIN